MKKAIFSSWTFVFFLAAIVGLLTPERGHAQGDTSPPNLSNFTPSTEAIFYTSYPIISFSIESNEPLSYITFNGVPGNLTSGFYYSGLNFINNSGVYQITVEAADLSGNISTINYFLDIVFDVDAPVVQINTSGNFVTNNSSFELSVSVSDSSPIALDIFQNGIFINRVYDSEASILVTLRQGTNEFSVVARDAAYNTSATVSVSGIVLDTLPPKITNLLPSDGTIIEGLTLNKASDVSVENIEFISSSPKTSTVKLTNSSGVSITGSTISLTGKGKSGIEIKSSSSNIVLTGNKIVGNSSDGVIIRANSVGILLTDNDISLNGDNGVRIESGAEAILKRNRIEENGVSGSGSGIRYVGGPNGNPMLIFLEKNQILNNLGKTGRCSTIDVENYCSIFDGTDIDNITTTGIENL